MMGEMSEHDGERHSEWVADIYHKGKRLRFRGVGSAGDDTLMFSLIPVRHELGHETRVNAHLNGSLVSYIDAPPPIFTEGAEN